MRTLIISYLLHAANRNIKGKAQTFIDEFYKLKDAVLQRHGKVVCYDVQNIPGKKCNSCGGRGTHPKYGHNGKIYDYADCYHCWGGWYKFPIWVCLHRIQLGSFIFHKPLKREETINNPFTKDELGWEVSEYPVIKGYIDHEKHRLGGYAIFILFWLYNRDISKRYFKQEFHFWKCNMRWKYRGILQWQTYIFNKPKILIRFYYDDNFSHADDELPF